MYITLKDVLEQTGDIWFDDVKVTEMALLNVVRRVGAPLSLRDKRTRTLYTEQVGHHSDLSIASMYITLIMM